MHLDPARYLIYIFGGVRATSRALGCSAPVVSNWKKVGKVPGRARMRILELAKKNNLPIDSLILDYGKDVPRTKLMKPIF
jgi:hypothetical protein